LEVEIEDFVAERHGGRSLWASFRAGVRDLRQFPGLVTMAAVTVFVGTAVALLGPLVVGLAEAGDTYVTMNSEVIVLVDTVQAEEDLDSLIEAISDVEGVKVVRESTPDDLAALPPFQLLSYRDGVTLTIEPTGAVPVEAIHGQVLFVAGVDSAAPGVGVMSQMAIDLVRTITPWLAIGFFAAGLLLVANLAYMTARIRREEVVAMRLVGAGTWSLWVRTSLVVVFPTVLVIVVVTGLVALSAPWVSTSMLPDDGAIPGIGDPVVSIGLRLAGAAAVVALITSLASMWRVAAK